MPEKPIPLCRFRGVVLIALLLSALASQATAEDGYYDIRFRANKIVQGDVTAEGFEFSLDRAGRFSLTVDRLQGLPVFQHGLLLEGELETLELADDATKASGLVDYRGVATAWTLSLEEGRSTLCLEADAKALGQLPELDAYSNELSWIRSGRFDGCAHLVEPESGPERIEAKLKLAGLSFDSPDGRFAAEALDLGLDLASSLAEPAAIEARAEVSGGEILVDNFYADFSNAPLTADITPRWNGEEFAGLDLFARDGGAVELEAGWMVTEDAWSLDIRRLDLSFPAAYSRYVEPLAAVWTLDGLAVSGSVTWSGRLGPEQFRSGDLEIADLSVVDTARNRFALTGLETRLKPGNHDVNSRLSWRGLLLGRVNLGAGSALLDSEPGAFALLEPLELDLLGGSLSLDRLAYRLPGAASQGAPDSRFEIEARLDQVDMEALTAALDWPPFSGKLSGQIPGATLRDGVLSVDGEIRVEVFDGAVVVRELEAERLFGVLPSLSASIDLEDLDLEQLTETFEFGRIGGRVDGYVHDLRMLEWQPVAFDAWLGTPERQGGAEAISRQAVNHLTTIGGGGATTALTSPLLRMFNSFSYRRLGLGCRLQNHTCTIRGISEDGDSVLLLEGAGIPRISVRAWNRSVDWPQMVANLTAISSGESIRVGDAPDP